MAAPVEIVNGEQSETTQEYLYKILVIGEFGVGKTSLIKRYTEGFFSPNYKLTIGVDFALKSLVWDAQTKINLQLWDIAGHERFGHMTRVYYKYAIAALIVFDLSRPATFDAVLKWLNDVNSKVMLANGKPVPVILLANKCDIDKIEVSKEEISQFCQDHNILGWFPTSAKYNINIEEAVSHMVSHILGLNSVQIQADPASIELSNSYSKDSQRYLVEKEGSKCCHL